MDPSSSCSSSFLLLFLLAEGRCIVASRSSQLPSGSRDVPSSHVPAADVPAADVPAAEGPADVSKNCPGCTFVIRRTSFLTLLRWGLRLLYSLLEHVLQTDPKAGERHHWSRADTSRFLQSGSLQGPVILSRDPLLVPPCTLDTRCCSSGVRTALG